MYARAGRIGEINSVCFVFYVYGLFFFNSVVVVVVVVVQISVEE